MSVKTFTSNECVNSTQHSIYTRRCFVTGELCSKQTNVHKEREKLHKNDEINAFVIMNFSGMSDVVYKWKLQSFIESLKQYLYLDKDGHQIACVSNADNKPKAKAGKDPKNKDQSGWTPVKKINVIRADSNTASNYIICSRICQQIQIADLIIVDVSVENTNVFYEFGLAAAFGKLILPICYNESFYEMKIPEKAAELLEKKRKKLAENGIESGDTEELRKRIEHHIDCYPWRRKLFENYGIRYRNSKSQVHYGLFKDVTQDIYGFSDRRYRRFPYDTIIGNAGDPLIRFKGEVQGEDCKKIGFLIYDRLRSSYHTKKTNQEDEIQSQPHLSNKYADDWAAKAPDNKPALDPHNTLIVYTMDGILNEEQSGQCIINFYNNMTSQIQKEHCFCGDRVAVLSQANVIPDDPKDTKVGKKLLYSVGDIIRIGMNQATYVAHQQRIKTDDYLLGDTSPKPYAPPAPDSPKCLLPNSAEFKNWKQSLKKWNKDKAQWIRTNSDSISAEPDVEYLDFDDTKNHTPEDCLKSWTACTEEWEKYHKIWEENWKEHTNWPEEAIRFIKEHIRNRCIPLLPDEPIYVKQYTEGIQQNLFHVDELKNNKSFDHTNFFTLFHMMLYTLRYANEVVVDISGNSLQALFWLGVAHGCDIPAITVRHAPTAEELSRMENPNVPKDRRIFDVAGLWTATLNSNDVDSFYDQLSMTQTGIEQHNRLTLSDIDNYRNEFSDLFYETWRGDHGAQKNDFGDFITRKREEEGKKLESYYRNSFWSKLLRYNELDVYIARYEGSTGKQPRILDISWDVQATAEINKYLSKRTVIGQYHLQEINKSRKNENSIPRTDPQNYNFISIGGASRPLLCKEKPLRMSLARHISQKPSLKDLTREIFPLPIRGYKILNARKKYEAHPVSDPHTHQNIKNDKHTLGVCQNRPIPPIRGFHTVDGKKWVFTQFPTFECTRTSHPDNCFLEDKRVALSDDYFERSNIANRLHFNSTKTVLRHCELRPGTNQHQQLAQMLLWREVPDDEDNEDIKFWVSLVGVSGPSTLALTSLLVDDQQKELLFTKKNQKNTYSIDWCQTPLKDLQYHIRRKILEEFDKKLKSNLETSSNKTEDCEHLSYVTKSYLSTILYQYFFPFISKTDEKRILNSMKAFLNAIAAADGDTFKEIKSITVTKPSGEKTINVNISSIVTSALEETIESLRGVDVLYTITVKSDGGEEDDRWPVDIRYLDSETFKDSVTCLFVNAKSSAGESTKEDTDTSH